MSPARSNLELPAAIAKGEEIQMRCLHCGVEMDLLKKLRTSGEFCSDDCKQSQNEEVNRLALERLVAQRKRTTQRKSFASRLAATRDIPVAGAPASGVGGSSFATGNSTFAMGASTTQSSKDPAYAPYLPLEIAIGAVETRFCPVQLGWELGWHKLPLLPTGLAHQEFDLPIGGFRQPRSAKPQPTAGLLQLTVALDAVEFSDGLSQQDRVQRLPFQGAGPQAPANTKLSPIVGSSISAVSDMVAIPEQTLQGKPGVALPVVAKTRIASFKKQRAEVAPSGVQPQSLDQQASFGPNLGLSTGGNYLDLQACDTIGSAENRIKARAGRTRIARFGMPSPIVPKIWLPVSTPFGSEDWHLSSPMADLIVPNRQQVRKLAPTVGITPRPTNRAGKHAVARPFRKDITESHEMLLPQLFLATETLGGKRNSSAPMADWLVMQLGINPSAWAARVAVWEGFFAPEPQLTVADKLRFGHWATVDCRGKLVFDVQEPMAVLGQWAETQLEAERERLAKAEAEAEQLRQQQELERLQQEQERLEQERIREQEAQAKALAEAEAKAAAELAEKLSQAPGPVTAMLPMLEMDWQVPELLPFEAIPNQFVDSFQLPIPVCNLHRPEQPVEEAFVYLSNLQPPSAEELAAEAAELADIERQLSAPLAGGEEAEEVEPVMPADGQDEASTAVAAKIAEAEAELAALLATISAGTSATDANPEFVFDAPDAESLAQIELDKLRDEQAAIAAASRQAKQSEKRQAQQRHRSTRNNQLVLHLPTTGLELGVLLPFATGRELATIAREAKILGDVPRLDPSPEDEPPTKPGAPSNSDKQAQPTPAGGNAGSSQKSSPAKTATAPKPKSESNRRQRKLDGSKPEPQSAIAERAEIEQQETLPAQLAPVKVTAAKLPNYQVPAIQVAAIQVAAIRVAAVKLPPVEGPVVETLSPQSTVEQAQTPAEDRTQRTPRLGRLSRSQMQKLANLAASMPLLPLLQMAPVADRTKAEKSMAEFKVKRWQSEEVTLAIPFREAKIEDEPTISSNKQAREAQLAALQQSSALKMSPGILAAARQELIIQDPMMQHPMFATLSNLPGAFSSPSSVSPAPSVDAVRKPAAMPKPSTGPKAILRPVRLVAPPSAQTEKPSDNYLQNAPAAASKSPATSAPATTATETNTSATPTSAAPESDEAQLAALGGSSSHWMRLKATHRAIAAGIMAMAFGAWLLTGEKYGKSQNSGTAAGAAVAAQGIVLGPDAWRNEWGPTRDGKSAGRQFSLYLPSENKGKYTFAFQADPALTEETENGKAVLHGSVAWVTRCKDMKNYEAMKLMVRQTPGQKPLVKLVHFGVLAGREMAPVERPLSIALNQAAPMQVRLLLENNSVRTFVNDQLVEYGHKLQVTSGMLGFSNEEGERATILSANVTF